MPQSLGKVYAHLIIETKDGRPFLSDRALREDLHGYVTGILRVLECQSLRVGGVDDHVHVLFRLSRLRTLQRVVNDIRDASLVWVRGRGLAEFDWRDGESIFSVSPQHLDRVARYIRHQERHHRRKSLADEYRDLAILCGGLEPGVDVHMIFSTKNRRPLLADKVLRDRLHGRIEGICERVDCPAFRVGGVEDHLHLLCRLSRSLSLARLAQEVKKRSTTWLVSDCRVRDFDWQDGYGAFSVSPQHVRQVCRYIENQEEHHRAESFSDESARLRQLGSKAGNQPT